MISKVYIYIFLFSQLKCLYSSFVLRFSLQSLLRVVVLVVVSLTDGILEKIQWDLIFIALVTWVSSQVMTHFDVAAEKLYVRPVNT